MANTSTHALVMAGIPQVNHSLYQRLRFSVGDPVAIVQFYDHTQPQESILILRDIEMVRARQQARVDRVACPADYAPEEGLSGDRETATAQAAAECMRRSGIKRAIADRSLPLIFAEMISRVGITVDCDLELGVMERRAKDSQEIGWLRQAQKITEEVMQVACELIASADVDDKGVLIDNASQTGNGQELTSQRVRAVIDRWLLERNFSNPPAIVAGGPKGADCHYLGDGPLRTGEPILVDIFPCDRATRYHGDCTRTVVHGTVPDQVSAMHAAVLQAKKAAIEATRSGVTGEEVHRATVLSITESGFRMGLPGENEPEDYCGMTHGTGHGVGLDVHEPPLLDHHGRGLIVGDALTIEPGLYCKALGGVRVEDMVVVTAQGCENLNHLHPGLDWA